MMGKSIPIQIPSDQVGNLERALWYSQKRCTHKVDNSLVSHILEVSLGLWCIFKFYCVQTESLDHRMIFSKFLMHLLYTLDVCINPFILSVQAVNLTCCFKNYLNIPQKTFAIDSKFTLQLLNIPIEKRGVDLVLVIVDLRI